jgi:hypothetical protein
VASKTGDGKVSENWSGEAPVFALGFSRNRREGFAAKNLAEALQTEAATYKPSGGPGGQNGNSGKDPAHEDEVCFLFSAAARPSSGLEPVPAKVRIHISEWNPAKLLR